MENLKKYAVQISDIVEYTKEKWRSDHLGYFYEDE